MEQNDFADIMKETVPELFNSLISDSPSDGLLKRDSPEEVAPEAVGKPEPSRARTAEVLSV